MTRRRLVFLGCGAVTAQHSRTLRAIGAEVDCYYASRDGRRAASYERRLRGAGSFGSYEAALADGSIDVALVATPPATHRELVLAALRAGKHVIVEKPAFLEARDFDAVERAQEEAGGGRVFVAENYAYKPLARTLRALLAAGAVGELRFVQINALKHQSALGWRASPETAGGGALFEGGIHWIDLIAHLGPRVLRARTVRAGARGGPERSSLLVLEYEGGAVGTLAHSWEIDARLRGLQLSRIAGTRGSIVFESNGLFVVVSGPARPRFVVPGVRDIGGYEAMFQDFLCAIHTGREPLMTLARARRDHELARADAEPDRMSHAVGA
jgi:predicted dehydrogenase